MGKWATSLVMVFSLSALAAESEIWSGTSGGVMVEWNPTGIYKIEKDTRKPLIDPLEGIAGDGETGCSVEGTLKVLSVVGPYLSFESRHWKNCPDKPVLAESIQWGVLDARSPKSSVKITEFFSEDSVLKGLLANKTIQRTLKRIKAKRPTTLASLMNSMNRVAILYDSQDYDCLVSLEKLLNQFTFVSLQKDRVLVRLFGALEGHKVCHEKPMELDLVLKPKSMTDLKLAAARKQGYLQKDFESLSKGKNSRFKRELSCEVNPTGMCSPTDPAIEN